MAKDYVSSVIVHGAPVAWMQEITVDTLSEVFHFNYLQDIEGKMARGGSAGAGSNNTDISGADGSILRFPKESLIIDAITEEQVVEDASTSADATGYGEITITYNKSPLDASYKKWTTFLKTLNEKKDSLWLIAIPTGFTHKGRYQDLVQNVDGYMYLICKCNSDIVFKLTGAPVTVALTFISFRGADSLAGGDLATALTTATWTAIDMQIGTSKNITLTPPDLTADDAAVLKVGKPVLKEIS